MIELSGLEAADAKVHEVPPSRLMRNRMAGPKSSGHPICAAQQLGLQPAKSRDAFALDHGLFNIEVPQCPFVTNGDIAQGKFLIRNRVARCSRRTSRK